MVPPMCSHADRTRDHFLLSTHGAVDLITAYAGLKIQKHMKVRKDLYNIPLWRVGFVNQTIWYHITIMKIHIHACLKYKNVTPGIIIERTLL